MDIHTLIQKLSKRTAYDDAEGLSVLTGEEEGVVLTLLEDHVELINEADSREGEHYEEINELKEKVKKLEGDNKKLKSTVLKLKQETKVRGSAKALQQLLNNG